MLGNRITAWSEIGDYFLSSPSLLVYIQPKAGIIKQIIDVVCVKSDL